MASRRARLGRGAAMAGVASSVAILAGCAVSGLSYTGADGEAYSPLNHWISELGQLGVARMAHAFNVLVGLSSAFFLVFVIGLWLTSGSRLRWGFGPAGVVAGIGGLFVGIFPMNDPTPHVTAAGLFFGFGWIFVALASIAFVRQREARHPIWLGFAGVVPVVASIAFIVSLRVDAFARERMGSAGPITDRPDVWVAAILEWTALVSIIAWVLLTSLVWLRASPRDATGASS